MKSPKTEEGYSALMKGKCPDCGSSISDLRSSSASPETHRGHGRCCGDNNGYECNKVTRDQVAARSTPWK